MKEFTQKDIYEFIEQNNCGLIYLYTPLCGTCQTATKMLTVIENLLPDLHLFKTNLNYAPDFAKQLSVESVPCLLFIKAGTIQEKIYAFQSVPFLLEKIKQFTNGKKVH